MTPSPLAVIDGDQPGDNRTPSPLAVVDGDHQDNDPTSSPPAVIDRDQPGDHLTPSIKKTDGDQPDDNPRAVINQEIIPHLHLINRDDSFTTGSDRR